MYLCTGELYECAGGSWPYLLHQILAVHSTTVHRDLLLGTSYKQTLHHIDSNMVGSNITRFQSIHRSKQSEKALKREDTFRIPSRFKTRD